MSPTEILSIYEREMRVQAEPPGMRRIVCGNIIRLVDDAGERGCVIFSRLDETSADAAIRQEIDFFRSIRQTFEWKLFGYDTPGDLAERLGAAGFEAEPVEDVMVLDLDDMPEALNAPVTHDVRRLAHVEQLVDLERVHLTIWKEASWIFPRLRRDMTDAPDSLSVYVVYHDGAPVSAGWIDFQDNSQFAAIWGGATAPEFRRRGFYRALLAARAQEARHRGRRFLTIDAGPMSRPIVERNGFRFLARAQEFVWKPA